MASNRLSLSQLPISGWFLIAANLVPLIGVLAFDWDVFKVLILFWAENVIIGLVQVLRMTFAGDDHGEKLTLIPFFVMHYGMFTLGHGTLLMGLFGDQANAADSGDGLFTVIDTAAQLFSADRELLIGFAALLLSHLVSFGNNYLAKGLYQTAKPSELFAQPYGRVIIMHVTVMAGAFAVQALGSPIWALLVLIALKTGFDLNAQLDHNATDSQATVTSR